MCILAPHSYILHPTSYLEEIPFRCLCWSEDMLLRAEGSRMSPGQRQQEAVCPLNEQAEHYGHLNHLATMDLEIRTRIEIT